MLIFENKMEGKIFFLALWFVSLLFTSICIYPQGKNSTFSRTVYYAVMREGTLKDVNSQISGLQNDSIQGKQAYLGALLMKKAGFPTNPEKKLSLFKSGRKGLESAIRTDSLNTEYRFLRLMIQEHAPGVLGYSNNLDRDKTLICKTFRIQPLDLQKAIIDYAQKSRIIRPQDL